MAQVALPGAALPLAQQRPSALEPGSWHSEAALTHTRGAGRVVFLQPERLAGHGPCLWGSFLPNRYRPKMAPWCPRWSWRPVPSCGELGRGGRALGTFAGGTRLGRGLASLPRLPPGLRAAPPETPAKPSLSSLLATSAAKPQGSAHPQRRPSLQRQAPG